MCFHVGPLGGQNSGNKANCFGYLEWLDLLLRCGRLTLHRNISYSFTIPYSCSFFPRQLFLCMCQRDFSCFISWIYFLSKAKLQLMSMRTSYFFWARAISELGLSSCCCATSQKSQPCACSYPAEISGKLNQPQTLYAAAAQSGTIR